MRAFFASASAAWMLAVASFATPASAQQQEQAARPMASFDRRPQIDCMLTSGQFKMGAIDTTIWQQAQNFDIDKVLKKGGEPPSLYTTGMTATTGPRVLLADRIELMSDQNVVEVSQIGWGGKGKSVLVYKTGDDYEISIRDNITGEPRKLTAEEELDKEKMLLLGTSLISEGQKYIETVCPSQREKLKATFGDSETSWSTAEMEFDSEKLATFRNGLSRMMDLAGVPRQIPNAPPPRAYDAAAERLKEKAWYILGLVDNYLGKFGPAEKCQMQAELIQRTGMKVSKSGRPDCKVGPMTANAARRFLQMERT